MRLGGTSADRRPPAPGRGRDDARRSASTRCAPPTRGCSAPTRSTRPAPAPTTPTSCCPGRAPTRRRSEYVELTLRPGSEISAVGVWAWYHLSALQKATRLANEKLAPAERRALARAMLADEAFALHFLEDTFAAGHVAGHLGRRVAAQGHARLLQRDRPGGLHLGGRQRVGRADGRRAHAPRGCRARRGGRPRRASRRCIDHGRPVARGAALLAVHARRPRPSPTLSTSARTTCSCAATKACAPPPKR